VRCHKTGGNTNGDKGEENGSDRSSSVNVAGLIPQFSYPTHI